jgi:hypothetical protein
MVEGVRRGSGKGLNGMSMIGDNPYDDGGWRGLFSRYRFRHGSEFSGELKFDAI